MTHRPAILLALVLLFASASPLAVPRPSKHEKAKNTDCSKPPALVMKGDQKKAKQIRMVGTVAAEIGEDGTVQTASVVRATSEEAGELLVHLAKSMKFAARPGCGVYRTQFDFGTK
jgi:hypothetical protein